MESGICSVPPVYRTGRRTRDSVLPKAGDYSGKVVEVDAQGNEYRPWDLSITKNVLAIIICGLVMFWAIFPLVRFYKRKPLGAPRKVPGMMEVVVDMLYRELIVGILGKDARKFAPYLLTLFSLSCFPIYWD